jgi:hypothetical protein
MDLRGIWPEDWIQLAQSSVAGCCEFCNEPWGSVQWDGLPDHLSISFSPLLRGVSY